MSPAAAFAPRPRHPVVALAVRLLGYAGLAAAVAFGAFRGARAALD